MTPLNIWIELNQNEMSVRLYNILQKCYKVSIENLPIDENWIYFETLTKDMIRKCRGSGPETVKEFTEHQKRCKLKTQFRLITIGDKVINEYGNIGFVTNLASSTPNPRLTEIEATVLLTNTGIKGDEDYCNYSKLKLINIP